MDYLAHSDYFRYNKIESLRGSTIIFLLLFCKKVPLRIYGTIKGVLVENEIEVLLGKRKEKESRSRNRYPVALEGVVDGIMIEGRTIRLRKPMYIQTINISANGILMKADSGCFDIGNRFSLNLKVEDSEVQLNCKIVYIPLNDANHPIIRQDGDIRQTDEEWYCKEILTTVL